MQITRARLAALALSALASFALAALTGSSPLRPAAPPVPLPPARALQPGDWVFRSGTSADSRLIQRLSGGAYSHIGIVIQTAPQVLVAHATTDDDPARPDQVLITPLADFAAAGRATAVAVARPRFLTAAQRAAAARHAAARAGQPFRLTAEGDRPLYCTTLVLEAVRQQAPGFAPAWQAVDVPVFGGRYLFPQAFALADVEWIAASAEPGSRALIQSLSQTCLCLRSRAAGRQSRLPAIVPKRLRGRALKRITLAPLSIA